MTDLTELTVAEIRDGVATGAFKAVEVAEAFNASVATAQGALNAFIVTTPDKALKPPPASMPPAPPASRSGLSPACPSA